MGARTSGSCCGTCIGPPVRRRPEAICDLSALGGCATSLRLSVDAAVMHGEANISAAGRLGQTALRHGACMRACVACGAACGDGLVGGGAGSGAAAGVSSCHAGPTRPKVKTVLSCCRLLLGARRQEPGPCCQWRAATQTSMLRKGPVFRQALLLPKGEGRENAHYTHTPSITHRRPLASGLLAVTSHHVCANTRSSSNSVCPCPRSLEACASAPIEPFAWSWACSSSRLLGA